MYKMSWPDLACASAARVSSALLAVKRSIWTSTFSFAAHSWINASEVLLASGTKWSQKPIESLPAACAVLTNGAATTVVDAAADAAMNRRRVNIFPLMVFAPFCATAASGQEKPAANRAIRSRLILSKLLRRDWQPAPTVPLHANQFVRGVAALGLLIYRQSNLAAAFTRERRPRAQLLGIPDRRRYLHSA